MAVPKSPAEDPDLVPVGAGVRGEREEVRGVADVALAGGAVGSPAASVPTAVAEARADGWRGAPFKAAEAAEADASESVPADGEAEAKAQARSAGGAAAQQVRAAGERPRLTYTELYEMLTPYRPPSKEEIEAERRRQERRMRFAAISDGISALSNLFFTSQYAPNMYDPTRGMTARTHARFEQLRREREANQRDYMQGYMRAMALDAQRDGDRWNRKHTLEREKVTDQYREAADRRAEARAERDAAMADLQMQISLKKIDAADADARRKEIRADYEARMLESQINRNNRSGTGRSGGGQDKHKVSYYDENNELQYAYGATYKEAAAEAERLSREAGTWKEDEVVTETESAHTDHRGRSNGTTHSTSRRKNGGHSEPIAPQPQGENNGGGGKKPNPMGSGSGGGNGKKPNPMG